MTLLHYASEPVVFDPDYIYTFERPHGHGKPVGLWVSVQGEQDWATWCNDEDFELGAFVHEVTLVPSANILWIDTGEGIDEFHTTYSVADAHYERLRDDPVFAKNNYMWWQRPIDWEKVATDYSGVVIAPYQWSRRLGISWYYGWDAASGCIWDLSAIATFNEIEG